MYLQFEDAGLIVGIQEWEERENEKRSGLREQGVTWLINDGRCCLVREDKG